MSKFFILSVATVLISCSRGPAPKKYGFPTAGEVENAILDVNQYITKRNRDHVKGFIRRTGWKMTQTGSGLWYGIKEEGTGKAAGSENRIILNYELRLINGKLISSSEKNGPLAITAGQSNIVSGLQEAVPLMKQNSEIRLILPPHLAYGNFGDSQLGIPPDAILIFIIKVLEIS